MNKLACNFFALAMSAAVLCGLSVTAAAASSNKDIMLVLDNSGSMKKNDPGFVTRSAVASFINQLDSSTRAGLLIFDHDVRMPVPLTAIDADTQAKLVSSLDSINYRGQLTDSPAAVERAIYELKTNARDESEKFIVFMTDGIVDTGNKEADVEKTKWLRDELAVDAFDNNIKVYAIAFTENADFFLIQSLAKKSNGEYFRALSPDDLAGVFDTVHEKMNAVPERPPEEVVAASPIVEPSGVVVTPEPEVAVDVQTLPPAAGDTISLEDLSEEERLALEDIAEQTGIPMEQLLQELVLGDGTAESGEPIGSEPIITYPEDAVTPEDEKVGAVILGGAALLLLLLVALVVWFIRRRSSAPSSGSETDSDIATSGVAGAEIPEAFLFDHNNYTSTPSLRLSERPLMVGRVAGNDTQHLDYLVVDKGTVGRRHAVIKYKDFSYWIVDQGSVNGTYVNGDRLSGEQQLKHGDTIRFHKYDFEFSQPDMDDGFNTVFADPNAADATIVASADDLAATAAFAATAAVGSATAGDETLEEGEDILGTDQANADAAVAQDDSPAAAFADSDVFDITGETATPQFDGSATAVTELADSSATAALDSSPNIDVPIPDDDDFDDPDTLITPPQGELPSDMPASPPNEDFDADASAFFDEITVGPSVDDESGPSLDAGDSLFDAGADEQAALDAKLEQASALMNDGDDSDGFDPDATAKTELAPQARAQDFNEMDTMAAGSLPSPTDPKDVTLDKFIETDSFDAPATQPPGVPKSVPDDTLEEGVSLDEFMSTAMIDGKRVQLTNEDETLLPDQLPDDENPLARDTVIMPGSPADKQRQAEQDNDEYDDDDDPTVLR